VRLHWQVHALDFWFLWGPEARSEPPAVSTNATARQVWQQASKIEETPYHAVCPALSTLSGKAALLVGEECEAPSHSKDEGTHRDHPHPRSLSIFPCLSSRCKNAPWRTDAARKGEGAAEPIPTPSLCSHADKKLATTTTKSQGSST